ncbi:MAG: hypothetical protein HYZ28_22965 [Myxococcales bacterium]|nr:hypothetical protein [Myxococcales bacterium]
MLRTQLERLTAGRRGQVRLRWPGRWKSKRGKRPTRKFSAPGAIRLCSPTTKVCTVGEGVIPMVARADTSSAMEPPKTMSRRRGTKV